MNRVPWTIVTWQQRRLGPGAAVQPKQTRGAAVFKKFKAAEEWVSARVAAGDFRLKDVQVYNGDPEYCGGAAGDWDDSVDKVFA